MSAFHRIKWAALLLLSGCLLGTSPLAAQVMTVDASSRPPLPSEKGFKMGAATTPDGHTLAIDSYSLVRDGKPWVTISAEFHYARCPQAEWRDELLKLKAGGVNTVASYIFWIHHEEEEGKWDWSGQRDLHKFLELCKEVGLTVQLRIGPWCHGEVLNGGFPNWLQKKGDDKVFELRRDNPGYLAYVQKLYDQIAQQVKGEMWKDGGPLIGIQLENEYSGPTQHLLTLKKMAVASGIDVPMYYCTGWGSGGAPPFGEMLTLSGSYVDGFWDRSLRGGGGGGAFRISGSRRVSAAAMGMVGGDAAASTAPEPVLTGVYPYFMCEIGGGMMPSYHRRIFMSAADSESLGFAKLASGCNLLGFYMFHGGQNPDGKLTNLNETQASGYWNDLPVKNYDFQAPLGQYGQEREAYHFWRQIGLFLDENGAGLANMTARMPNGQGLNSAVRSNGSSGYIFVCNYARLQTQPPRQNVQFAVKLAGGEIKVPSEPVTIADNCRFIWPLNMDLGGVKLIEASAQPICHVDDGNTRYDVFKQTAGAPSEFVFDAATTTLDSSTGKATTENGQIHLANVQPGLGAAITLKGKDNRSHVIILLDEATAWDVWKGPWQGQDRLFITHANLLLDGPTVRLRTEDPKDCTLAILPAPANITAGGAAVPAKDDGLFRRFTPVAAAVAPLAVTLEQVQPAGPARTIPLAGSVPGRQQGMAMQPEDADFAQAAVWRVKLPAGTDAGRDLRLIVHYTGDVARAYNGDKLIDDDFYHTQAFEIGLKRYGPAVYQNGITLKILPLRQDAPIFLTDPSKLKFDANHIALTLDGIDVVETREVRLEAAK